MKATTTGTPDRVKRRVPAQVRPNGNATSLLSPAIGAFALELAARLEPTQDLIARYGMTWEEYRALLARPEFRDAVKEASQAFAASSNTPERVKLKAALLVEMGLEEMWHIMADSGHSAAARVAAFSAVTKLTGLEKPEAAVPVAKFELLIQLPPVPALPASGLLIDAQPDMAA